MIWLAGGLLACEPISYLDFEVSPFDGQPITLRNVMTHTPGFEEIVKNLMVSEPERLLPLGTYLKTRTPNRIFVPGKVPAYSNYGAALAGYIVERVSGERFDDYVDRHLFSPLGMADSTFRQPLPARFAANISRATMSAVFAASRSADLRCEQWHQ